MSENNLNPSDHSQASDEEKIDQELNIEKEDFGQDFDYEYTVKPVLADHSRAVKKWSANTVGPLPQVKLVLKCYTSVPPKGGPLAQLVR